MNPPKFLFLSINEVCNLRCRHCQYWRVSEPSINTLSISRITQILEEFAEMSPEGSVVICGGEPLLDPRAYFHVCSISRILGLRTLSVINGTLITSLKVAEKVIVDGPDEISISLDGPTAEIHDRLRGVPGSFFKATGALLALRRARYLNPLAKRKINAMVLLCASTYQVLEELYHLTIDELGIDKMKLNAIQPTFTNARLFPEAIVDLTFKTESQVDPDLLAHNLQACDERWKLNLDPQWIAQVTSYFRRLWKTPNLELGWAGNFQLDDHLCNTYERNIMVSVDGVATLCFSSQFTGQQLTKYGDLRRFWENARHRDQMKKCNALCSISHSVRKTSATLPKVTP